MNGAIWTLVVCAILMALASMSLGRRVPVPPADQTLLSWAILYVLAALALGIARATAEFIGGVT